MKARAQDVLDGYFEVIGWCLLATSGLGKQDELADQVMHTDADEAFDDIGSRWFGQASLSQEQTEIVMAENASIRPHADASLLAEPMSERPPEWMAAIAEKGLEEAKENGAGTRVGKTRANQLKNRKPLSRSVLNRLISFLSRHKGQLSRSQNQEKRKTAMALWGGGSKSSAERAISWARGQLRKMAD